MFKALEIFINKSSLCYVKHLTVQKSLQWIPKSNGQTQRFSCTNRVCVPLWGSYFSHSWLQHLICVNSSFYKPSVKPFKDPINIYLQLYSFRLRSAFTLIFNSDFGWADIGHFNLLWKNLHITSSTKLQFSLLHILNDNSLLLPQKMLSQLFNAKSLSACIEPFLTDCPHSINWK